MKELTISEVETMSLIHSPTPKKGGGGNKSDYTSTPTTKEPGIATDIVRSILRGGKAKLTALSLVLSAYNSHLRYPGR